MRETRSLAPSIRRIGNSSRPVRDCAMPIPNRRLPSRRSHPSSRKLLSKGAGLALERILWIEQNASTIVVASAHQQHLVDVEDALADTNEGGHAE